MHLIINEIPVIEVELANTTRKRMIGLMFQKNIKKGLLLFPNNSIHTFFMKEAIDVVYLNKQNEIIKISQEMRPWRVGPIVFKGVKTLELPLGSVNIYLLKVGQLIQLK